jgi:hypothetical protein
MVALSSEVAALLVAGGMLTATAALIIVVAFSPNIETAEISGTALAVLYSLLFVTACGIALWSRSGADEDDYQLPDLTAPLSRRRVSLERVTGAIVTRLTRRRSSDVGDSVVQAKAVGDSFTSPKSREKKLRRRAGIC